MMRRTTLAAIALACAFTMPQTAGAQSFDIGAGGAFSVGGFAEELDNGWWIGGGPRFPVADRAWIGLDGLFAKVDGGPSTTIWAAFGTGRIALGRPGRTGPYLKAGVGVLSAEQLDGGTARSLAFQGGGGLDLPLGTRVSAFAEARWVGAVGNDFIEERGRGKTNVSFIGLLAGFAIDLTNRNPG